MTDEKKTDVVKTDIDNKIDNNNTHNDVVQNVQKQSTALDGKVEDRAVTKPVKKKKENSFRLYRFLRVLLRPIGAILFPYKVINKENIDKIEGGLVICNHYSQFDGIVPLLKLFKKEAHVLSKYELFENPIGGWFMRKMGAIPVHRGEADIDAVKSVLRVLRGNKKLLLFPEGTRNKEGTQEMAEFKDGTSRFAIKTNSPVVPMIYYGMPKMFKRNYLYIGEPFTLEQFKDARTPEAYKAATDYIYNKMVETRRLCNEYVEDRHRNNK